VSGFLPPYRSAASLAASHPEAAFFLPLPRIEHARGGRGQHRVGQAGQPGRDLLQQIPNEIHAGQFG